MTSSSPPFTAQASRFKDIFFSEESRLHVPDYQREFSWTKEQFSTFWEELVGPEALRGKFAGTILLLNQESGDSVEIVDGQQRASIATIILAAIRDVSARRKHENFSASIQRTDIEVFNPDTFESEGFRLTPSLSCRQYYCDSIQTFPPSNVQPDTKEHHRVKDAYDFFSTQVEREISNEEANELEMLREFRAKVRDLRVVRINVYQESIKFEIFESVNARGLSLSPADLIKNYVISKTRQNRRNAINEKWMRMVEISEESGIAFTDVIRYNWNGIYGFVTKRRLFEAIKKKKTNQAEIASFVDELGMAAETIELLKRGSPDDVKEGFAGPRKHADAFDRSNALMNVLGVKLHLVVFSTLHRLRKQLPPGQVARLASTVSIFALTHVGVCQNPISRPERVLARICRQLVSALELKTEKSRAKKVVSVFSKARQDLLDIWPNDEQIREGLEELQYDYRAQNKGLIRCLLASLEMERSESSEVIIDWSAVNIEHIQPQNPENPKDLAKFEDHVHLLGNLSLITEKLNKKLGNKSPDEKAPLLDKSKLEITREVGAKIQADGWSPKAIASRTEELNEALLELLRRPDS